MGPVAVKVRSAQVGPLWPATRSERRHPLGIVGSRSPADRLPLEDRLLTRDVAKGIHRIEDVYTNWYLVEESDAVILSEGAS